MKYLKRYNESVKNEEILDVCEEYLAYVLDNIKDSKLRIDNSPIYDDVCSVSFFRSEPNHNRFSWDDIKDDFITLVDILNNKFGVIDVTIMTNKSIPIKINNPEEPSIDHFLTVDDILEDNIIRGVDDIMIIIIKLKK